MFALLSRADIPEMFKRRRREPRQQNAKRVLEKRKQKTALDKALQNLILSAKMRLRYALAKLIRYNIKQKKTVIAYKNFSSEFTGKRKQYFICSDFSAFCILRKNKQNTCTKTTEFTRKS